jgi:hypothetical protein
MTFKISEDIKIELYGSTSFIIGQSILGGPALLGDLSPTWHPLTCGVVSVDIERGFSVNQGIVPSLEVGTANIVLSGFDVDPTLNPLFQIDGQIKVLVREPGQTNFSPIFVGFIDNMETTYESNGLITTTLTCTDWIPKIMNITVPEGAYVAPAEGFSTRVNRVLDDFVLPRYPDIEISPAWFLEFGGSQFPQEGDLDAFGNPEPNTGTRAATTVGDLLNELMQGEAGMIVVSRTGVIYGYGRYYISDYLLEELDLGTVPTSYGFSNVHSTSLDHYCMANIETSSGKADIVNELILGFSDTVPFPAFQDEKVNIKNEASIGAVGSIAFEGNLYVDLGPETNPTLYLQSWGEDITFPESSTRVKSLTWSPIRRDGLLNSSWKFDPGYDVTRVRIEYPGHTIDGKYMVSKVTHNITAENWLMGAELWKGA